MLHDHTAQSDMMREMSKKRDYILEVAFQLRHHVTFLETKKRAINIGLFNVFNFVNIFLIVFSM